MARNRPAGTPDPETTFEQAMNELEELVHALEGGTLPLDLLVDKYERGAGLLRVCRQRLDAAQQRIELITRTAAGTVALEPVSSGEGTVPATTRSVRKSSSPDHANSDEIRLL